MVILNWKQRKLFDQVTCTSNSVLWLLKRLSKATSLKCGECKTWLILIACYRSDFNQGKNDIVTCIIYIFQTVQIATKPNTLSIMVNLKQVKKVSENVTKINVKLK